MFQVEWSPRLHLSQHAELGLRRFLNAQVHPVQRQPDVCWHHALHRLPVLRLEARAQRFVPRHDPVQRAAQCAFVQLARQPQSHRDVVRLAAAFHLRQEPQPLLGERQRQRLAAVRCRDCRQCAALSSHDRLRHRAQAWLREQFRQPKLRAQLCADLRHQPHRLQRVAAQCEEIVMPPHTLSAQQRLPDRRERLLHLSLRGLVGRACVGLAFWGRQPLAVQLAVRCQWQMLQLHVRGWHHVLRQAALQLLAQRLCLNCFAAHVVRHQPRLAGHILAHRHHGLPHARALRQSRLDLPQLDPETAQLDLCVCPALVLQAAVRQPAPEVSCPVHPLTALTVEPVHDETLRRQLRTVQVTAGDTCAADVHLARHPQRYRLTVRIQHIDLRVRDRSTDADHAPPRVARLDLLRR